MSGQLDFSILNAVFGTDKLLFNPNTQTTVEKWQERMETLHKLMKKKLKTDEYVRSFYFLYLYMNLVWG